jgi:SAM-dependent methyltransferase
MPPDALSELHRVAEDLASVWQCVNCGTSTIRVQEDPAALACGHCGHVYPYQHGVLHVSKHADGSLLDADHQLISHSYSRIWRFSGEAWTAQSLSGEEPTFAWLQALNASPRVLLDAGCGTGRHIQQWLNILDMAGGPGLLLLLELSDVVEVAAQRRQEFPNRRIVVIRGSIEAMPFQKASVDLAWSSGVVSVIADQKVALDKLFEVTKGLLVLGLPTEKSLAGLAYLAAEPIRALRRWFKVDFAGPLSHVLAVSTVGIMGVARRFGVGLSAATRRMMETTLTHPDPARRLQASFYDIVGAPRIQKKADRFYHQAAAAMGFQPLSVHQNASVEYFAFTRTDRTKSSPSP